MEKDYLIANVKDKINLSKKRNKILNTCFYTTLEKALIEKELRTDRAENYFFFGGYEDAERECLIVYPEKFSDDIVRENLNNVIKVLRIKLPNELCGEYNHSTYLGSLMKLGLERERFGDIICFDEESYIILLSENAEYVKADGYKKDNAIHKVTIDTKHKFRVDLFVDSHNIFTVEEISKEYINNITKQAGITIKENIHKLDEIKLSFN